MADKPVLYGQSDDWNLPEEPSPLRHPARLLALAGAATAIVGVMLPWVNYGVDTFHASANGFTGDTWGIFAVATVGAQVGVLASRLAARSQARSIQLLPAFLGLLGLAIYFDAWLAAQQLADSYRSSGYTVSFAAGLWVLLVGVVLCAIGGLASSVVVWRAAAARRSNPDISAGQVAGQGAGFFAELAVGALVSLGSAIGGGVIALYLIHGNGEESGLIVLFTVLGVFVGAVVTHALWSRFISHE